MTIFIDIKNIGEIKKNQGMGNNCRDIGPGKMARCRRVLLDKLYNELVDTDHHVINLVPSGRLIKYVDHNINKNLEVI